MQTTSTIYFQHLHAYFFLLKIFEKRPFWIFGLLFFSFIFFNPNVSQAQVYNVNATTVDVSGLTLIEGTDLLPGAKYLKTGAVTLGGQPLDMVLTIDARDNVTNLVLDNDGSNSARFQPEINGGTGTSFVDFTFEFFTDYNTPALRQKVQFIDFWVTVVDNDGATNYQEYVEIKDFSSYERDITTALVIEPGAKAGFTRIRGTDYTVAGIVFENTASIITEYSLPVAEFQLRLGVTGTVDPPSRLFSVAIGSRAGFTFSNPVTTTNPTAPSYPDLGVAYLNSVKSGSVKTNDRLDPATTYSNPVANLGNPAGASFTLNSDGTYSFIATNPGIYRYVFDYCIPTLGAGGGTSCNQEILVLSAIDHEINTNLPVANNDFAARPVYGGVGPVVPTVIDVLANDNPGNINVPLDPSTLAVSAPTTSQGGSVSASGGFINYSPLVGFTGIDTFTYTIADNDGNSTTATVYVRVLLNDGSNYVVATDDYRNLVQGTTATGNALTNDQQTLTTTALSVVGGPTTLTDASGNTLNIAANGDYTFTPTSTFNGNTSFIYTASGTNGETATATIHFTVAPFEVAPDLGSVSVNNTINGNLKTNDDVLFGTTYGSYVLSSGPGGAAVSFTGNADGTYSFSTDTPGTYVYTYDVCSPTNPNPPCKTTTLTITVTDPLSTTNPPIANPDIAATYANANPALTGVPVTINVVGNDQPGNSGNVIVPSTADLVGTPVGVVDNGDGTFTYTPAAGFTGIFTFQYTVEDDDGRESSPTSVTITVYPDGSPNTVSATDDYVTTASGSPVARNAASGLLANDSQLDTTDPLVATDGTFTNPSEGILVLASDGSYTFTPAAGFIGTTQFPYTVSGTNGAVASGTAYFTVSPKIVSDVNVGFIDVSIPGNLNTNDLVETGTTYGGITADVGNPNTNLPVLAADGSYTFITDTPGLYNFTYEVCAPSMTSPDCYISTLSITVTDPGITTNPPIANNDIAITTANSDLALPGVPVIINVVANDQPGNPNNTIVPGTATLVGGPSGVVDNSDGTFTYTPPAGFLGEFTFEYTVEDDEGRTSAPATVYVTVYSASNPNVLIASDDYYSGLSTNIISTGNVLGNDTQLFGGAVTTVSDPGIFALTGGELTLNADGTFSFVPNPTFQGVASHTYTAEGTDGATGKATIYFTIYSGLDVVPDIGVAFKDKEIEGSVAVNDLAPLGSTYTTATVLPNATLTLNSDGTFTFVATATGVYTYNVQVCAPTTPPGCETKTLTITVTDPAIATNPPVANNDIAVTYADSDPATTAGQLVVINVLENDKPGNASGSLDASSVTEVGGPLSGLSNNGDGTFDYTPPIGQFPGEVSFQYSVSDGTNTTTATAFITIYPASSPNVVTPADDYYTGSVSANITGDVLLNDTQLDNGTALTVNNPGTYNNASGSLVLNPNGTFTFTPSPSFSGTTTFTYEAIGTDGAIGSGTLHLSVYGGLIINPDINVAFKDETINGSLITNDVVPVGSTYSNSTGSLANATLTLSSDGTYSFEATAVGVYTYNIEVCAPTTPPGCDTKTLTITVTDPALASNPPVANTDIYVGIEGGGTNVTGNVLDNDVDLSNTTLTVTQLNGVALAPLSLGGGTLNLGTNGAFTLVGVTTPGNYSFNYTIEDGDSETATTSVFITIYPTGTPNLVTAADDYASTNGVTPVSGNVLANDTQLSGVALSTVTNPGTFSAAGIGSLVLNADGSYTFTPVAGAEDVASFVYTAQGTDGATASATLYVSVYPPVTYTWIGGSTDWCDASNWDRGARPVSGANVTIPSTANDPVFDFSTCPVCINNLTISSGVTVGLTGKLCVTGNLNSAGEVIGTGSISLEGTTPQTIIGEFNITNLDLNNSTGATITAGAGNMVNITESLILTDGALTTNDNLRLISDASGDAYIAPITNCAGVSIVGNVRVQKFVDGGNRAFRFIAHPFDGTLSLQQIRDYVHITGEGLDFNDTGNPSAFWYNTAQGNQAEEDEDTGWVPVSSTNIGQWFKGRAVRMMFRGPRTQGGVVGDDNYNPSDVTYELIGPVNLCDQTLTGLRRVGDPDGNIGTAGNSAFNFIGNPFPAAIDLKTIPGGPTGSRVNVGPNYYVWEPRTGVQSGQTVFNTGAGRGGSYVAEPFDGGTAELGQLAIGTGFFVVANVDLAEITFTEANKLAQKQLSAGAAVTFREDGEIASRYGANSLQLAIDVNGEQIDRVLVYFDEETNAKVDHMDATKFENPAVNFFTVSEDDYAMAIDRRPWVEEEEYRIPLHILSPAVNYTLTVPDFDLESGRVVQLHDRYLDKLITLEKGATYAFTVTEEQASKGHRFDLVMGVEVVTSLNPTAARFQAFLLPNPAQQQVMVSIQRPDEVADTHVRLVDVRGVMLYETTLKATDDAQISYEVGGLAKGVYLVEITHGKQRIVKRLMVN